MPAWRRSERESPVWELAWEWARESERESAPALVSDWRPVLRSQTEENLPQQPEVKTRRLTSLKTCLCTRHRTAQRERKAPKRPWSGDVSCPRDSSGTRVPRSRAVVNSSQSQMTRLPSRALNPGRSTCRAVSGSRPVPVRRISAHGSSTGGHRSNKFPCISGPHRAVDLLPLPSMPKP